MGLANGRRRHFTQAQRAHLALAHQVTQRTHAVLDGHFFVPAVQVIQVDHIGLQAAQAVFAVAAQSLGATIDNAFDTVVELHTCQTTFAREREAAAVLFEHTADQRLVGTKAIQGGGVEQGDTRVECGQQQALGGLRAGRHTVRVAQVHAAKANAADAEGA